MEGSRQSRESAPDTLEAKEFGRFCCGNWKNDKNCYLNKMTNKIIEDANLVKTQTDLTELQREAEQIARSVADEAGRNGCTGWDLEKWHRVCSLPEEELSKVDQILSSSETLEDLIKLGKQSRKIKRQNKIKSWFTPKSKKSGYEYHDIY
jgi:ribosomal protein S13